MVYYFNTGNLIDGGGDDVSGLTSSTDSISSSTNTLTDPTAALADAQSTLIESNKALTSTNTDPYAGLTAAQRTAARAASYQLSLEAAQGIKPTAPPPSNGYKYEYVWRTDVGSTSTNVTGHWQLVKFPYIETTSTNYSFSGLPIVDYPKTTTLRPPSTFTPIVSPIPITPTQPSAPIVPPPPVKTAPIDTILFDAEDTLPIEIMADLIFENIGGQELINIARNDTINGQQVIYQPIKNLTQIQQQYNPNNIISLQDTSNKYFQNFPIKFDPKVPLVGSGPNGEHIYIDPATGSLIIDAVNLEPDEQIELEVVTSGTIYEAVI